MDQEIRGVLFDKDGTLLDFERTWTPVSRRCAELVARTPDEVPRLLHAVGHDPDTDRFQPGSPMVAGTAVDVAEAFAGVLQDGRTVDSLTAIVDRVFLEVGGAVAVPVEGLAAVVHTLHASGMQLGVATSDNTASAEAALTGLGLRSAFCFVCGYDAGFGGKPGPGMVLGFCEATGLSPAEVAVIGDSTHDLHMARAAGAGAAVGVLTGPATRADLVADADVVLASIAELPAWLSRRPRRDHG